MNPLILYAKGSLKCKFLGRLAIAFYQFYQILDESIALPKLNTLKWCTNLVFTYLRDGIW